MRYLVLVLMLSSLKAQAYDDVPMWNESSQPVQYSEQIIQVPEVEPLKVQGTYQQSEESFTQSVRQMDLEATRRY